jgi:hypothetical protein
MHRKARSVSMQLNLGKMLKRLRNQHSKRQNRNFDVSSEGRSEVESLPKRGRSAIFSKRGR